MTARATEREAQERQAQRIRDALVVLRAQQGDARAVHHLVTRWNDALVRHAGRLTGRPDAAQDIAQDTWVAVVKGLRCLGDAEAFPAWLFRIATNKCRDWVRSRQRRRGFLERFRLERVEDSIIQPNSNHLDEIEVALTRLPHDQREAVSLYYFEGFGIGEIADIVKAPPGTVKSRLYHARTRLRQILEEMEHE